MLGISALTQLPLMGFPGGAGVTPPTPGTQLVPLGVGHQGCYFFQFPDMGTGLLDPIVGPKIFTPAPGPLVLLGQPIAGLWHTNAIFPVSVYQLALVGLGPGGLGPLPGWWVCIIEPYPLDLPLSNHPNCMFILDRQAMFTTNSAIVSNRLSPSALINQISISFPTDVFTGGGIK